MDFFLADLPIHKIANFYRNFNFFTKNSLRIAKKSLHKLIYFSYLSKKS